MTFEEVGSLNENLERQVRLVTEALKIAKAVAANEQKALIQELAGQRKYITHLERLCDSKGIRIFSE